MKAFIIAGGEGTRLRPYTYTLPKPMLPVGGKPIIHYVLEHLKSSGVKEVVLAVGYLHEKISDYFSDGQKFGMKITYAVEKEALGTAGSILASKEHPKEPFFVVMGDAIMDLDLKALADAHKKSGAIATVALLKYKTKIPYGVANVNNGFIVQFQEKPELENYINIGIYVLSPEIFNFIKEKEDFAKDVFPRLLSKGKKIAAFKVEKGVWVDIGRLEEYEKLKDGKEIARMLGKI
ncbi:UTP--glucose-1-phosphate uridylyltransferase AglF [Candidatus Bilamarchaeum dharawalense]|uniref:UTP--glucose-1-phosphate uridylyltransferase AglF n=1 Tax=Candidatus Bilamarchaeum dharawalense TaxID=2885759 RepID=A0A5E4LNX7_9ARCH|nr:UTP--glucose-1-phosphate uridylyltransferase AglF [Candidatus Bilamarchaeum dharawalense]